MSYLRFILFVGGITVAIGASAKLSPRALDRLQSPPAPITEDAERTDAERTDEERRDEDVRAGERAASDIADEGEERSLWPDTFPVFVLGICMATVGVVLWRMELRRERQQRTADTRSPVDGSSPETAQPSDPVQWTLQGIATLDQLVVDAEQLRGWEIMRRVDQFLEMYVLPTVERRQEIMNRYGMADGAELLIALAYGERMLNRTWSAAADGHLPEARSCLPEAAEGFHEMRRLHKQFSEFGYAR